MQSCTFSNEIPKAPFDLRQSVQQKIRSSPQVNAVSDEETKTNQIPFVAQCNMPQTVQATQDPKFLIWWPHTSNMQRMLACGTSPKLRRGCRSLVKIMQSEMLVRVPPTVSHCSCPADTALPQKGRCRRCPPIPFEGPASPCR